MGGKGDEHLMSSGVLILYDDQALMRLDDAAIVWCIVVGMYVAQNMLEAMYPLPRHQQITGYQ